MCGCITNTPVAKASATIADGATIETLELTRGDNPVSELRDIEVQQ